MRLSKTFLSLFIVLLLGGTACSDLFNANNGNQPALEFTYAGADGERVFFNGDTLIFNPTEFPENNPPFIAKVKKNAITITGYFATPCSNWPPAGNINTSGENIIINIKPTEFNSCATVPGNVFYDAIIGNLDPGSHQVSIVHSSDVLRTFDDEEIEVFSREFVIE